jgi:hypothetical protein
MTSPPERGFGHGSGGLFLFWQNCGRAGIAALGIQDVLYQNPRHDGLMGIVGGMLKCGSSRLHSFLRQQLPILRSPRAIVISAKDLLVLPARKVRPERQGYRERRGQRGQPVRKDCKGFLPAASTSTKALHSR